MGHFSVYYKIASDQIIVMAFWDNRQDPGALFKSVFYGMVKCASGLI
jgi:hypothetical protein